MLKQKLIPHGKARSPDDTNELGANFMAGSPDHLACALLGHTVTRKEQHEFIGDV
jgi:hypothetical protein